MHHVAGRAPARLCRLTALGRGSLLRYPAPMSNPIKPSGADVWANLRSAGSPLAALRGMAANTWLKLKRRDDCCGNYGDPGC